MRALRIVVQVLGPLAVLAVGAAVLVMLVRTKPEAARDEDQDDATVVRVTETKAGDASTTVHAMGQVEPARTLGVSPQVQGRIVEVHPKLTPGGRIEEGEVLFRIEQEDYRLALEQAKAEVAQAELELTQQRGRQDVAKREWKALDGTGSPSPGEDGTGKELALKRPHVRAAKARLEAARSAVEQARLNLQRTTVEAPFDAYVREDSVEVGQQVGPQTVVARLVGTDRFFVEVSLPVSKLAWISVPGYNGPKGSTVTVVQDLGDRRTLERDGNVVRFLGEVDREGRMARLRIAVEDPLQLQRPPEERGVPLLVGSYVEARIQGRTLERVVAVPRKALRPGDRVWVMDEQGRLRIRSVNVVWREPDRVLVADGLGSGERLVTSKLAAPVKGMTLRVAEQGSDQPQSARAGADEAR